MLVKEIKKQTTTGLEVVAQLKSTEGYLSHGKPISNKYVMNIYIVIKRYSAGFIQSHTLHHEYLDNKSAGLQSMKNILDRKIAEIETGFRVTQ